MAVGVHALTTLADVKQALLRFGIETAHDPELERLIDVATAAFEADTRRRLKSRVYKPSGAAAGEVNLKLNGDDRLSEARFQLPEYPVTDVTALTLRDADLTNPTVVAVADVQMESEEDGILRFLPTVEHVWRKGVQNIELTFTAGLPSTHPHFPLLGDLCVRMVKDLFLTRDRQREGLSSLSVEGQSVSYVVRNLPQDVLDGLMRFRREPRI